jgi:hypothetical protein
MGCRCTDSENTQAKLWGLFSSLPFAFEEQELSLGRFRRITCRENAFNRLLPTFRKYIKIPF